MTQQPGFSPAKSTRRPPTWQRHIGAGLAFFPRPHFRMWRAVWRKFVMPLTIWRLTELFLKPTSTVSIGRQPVKPDLCGVECSSCDDLHSSYIPTVPLLRSSEQRSSSGSDGPGLSSPHAGVHV